MIKVYTFLAEGFEEVEALAVTDILLRAGADVMLVSISENLLVRGAHGIKIMADAFIDDVLNEDAIDLLFLPGGMPGATNLGKSDKLKNLLIKVYNEDRHIAAICAAPSVLGNIGLLKDKRATCYPGFENNLFGAEVITDKVVTDGNITTSRGMGTAIDLGLKLTELFYGSKTAAKISASIEYLSVDAYEV